MTLYYFVLLYICTHLQGKLIIDSKPPNGIGKSQDEAEKRLD